MSEIITCEQVSDGHPDKICDQIADAIVTDCLRYDKGSRAGIEVMIKDNHVIIAGELTTAHRPNYRDLVKKVFKRIYRKNKIEELPEIGLLVKEQSPDIALGVDKGGAGDQGMMYGYATNETPELLPIPFAVATNFLHILKAHPCRMFRADAKAQVSYDYDSGRITTFLCSVQHSPDVDPEDFRYIIHDLMVVAAANYGLNTDFEKLVNPTGRFVIGGPYADCGVTGRKLACDTYGGVAHIGGGSQSGKDPSKVDRSGAYIARKIARDIVLAGYAEKCEVQIAYAIGVAEPVSVNIETFDTGLLSSLELEDYVRNSYDLTPKGIIKALDLLNVDYNKVSSYGHFGKSEMPWEQ